MKVIRVLVYEGTEHWIDQTFRQHAVKKFHDAGSDAGGGKITEFVHGYTYPEVSREDLKTANDLLAEKKIRLAEGYRK